MVISSTFNPFNMSAQPIQVLIPSFNCQNDNPSLDVAENEFFNLTFSIYDSATQIPVPTLVWSVYDQLILSLLGFFF